MHGYNSSCIKDIIKFIQYRNVNLKLPQNYSPLSNINFKNKCLTCDNMEVHVSATGTSKTRPLFLLPFS
jgi:hypothetical protein